MLLQARLYRSGIDLGGYVILEPSHHICIEPTRMKITEASRVVGQVERESMPSDPAAHGDSDRRHFFLADPHAGQTLFAATQHAKICERIYHDSLEISQVSVQVAVALGQQTQRIRNKLAGPVPRRLSAPLDFIDLQVYRALK